MTSEAGASKNWFAGGGGAYARFRPDYPPELAAFLASIAPHTDHVVDAGCGNGQLTHRLAEHFGHVTGLDPSAGQIAHGIPGENIDYLCAPAEQMPLPDGCASLVTAAQAAHWFDLPRFYQEVKRLLCPGGVLALISYGVLSLDGEADACFRRFYTDEIGPYWPAERKLVDSGYAGIPFPFREQAAPQIRICLNWSLPEFLGYISTWSAVKAAENAGRSDLLETFARTLAELWGDPATRRAVQWPVTIRVGVVP